MFKFLVDHQVVLGALIVAILDFAFAISKDLRANGILDSIYKMVKGIADKPKAIG